LPPAGINYYRLSQTDFDDGHQFLKTIAIDFDKKNKPSKISPNPFNQQLQISLNSEYPENTQIKIFDINGGAMYSQFLSEDEIEIKVYTNDWPHGIYSVQIVSPQKVFTWQIVKVGK
jgi:hypothetical protein